MMFECVYESEPLPRLDKVGELVGQLLEEGLLLLLLLVGWGGLGLLSLGLLGLGLLDVGGGGDQVGSGLSGGS